MIAFANETKQVEKTQLTNIDRFFSEQYDLDDQNIDITIFSVPPMPENIGRFSYKQF